MSSNREMPPVMPSPEQSGAASKTARDIKVVALRNGFYDNRRIVPGDEFVVSNMAALGSWMKCVDPVIEKQHQAALKAKKQKAGF